MNVQCLAKCLRPCHHATPHKPDDVQDPGHRRGLMLVKDILFKTCTDAGRCDMGLFVKCSPVEDAREEGK